jgi:hypothetical protein
MHPTVEKNAIELSKFLTEIIKNRNINSADGHKHLIIIKHIDLLSPEYFISYRIILERFSNNAYFLCTAHNIAKVDAPIKSRFSLMRIPLFTNEEVAHIFKNYLHIDFENDQRVRNIMQAIFFLSTGNDTVLLNFPPIAELIKMKKSDIKLHHIRQMSYKCFQHNVSIPELLTDILKLLPKNTKNNRRMHIIKAAADLEHKLHLTKQGREPIYIEAFLCEVCI